MDHGIVRFTYPCPRAAYLGVPLLAVQTHLDTLTEEEARPHDDVEHGAPSLVVHGEVEHHLERMTRGNSVSDLFVGRIRNGLFVLLQKM